MNICSKTSGGCGEDFNSVELFDRHRVGVLGYSFAAGLRMDPPREDGRKCLDVEEMERRGWTKNKLERWIDPSRTSIGFLERTREPRASK